MRRARIRLLESFIAILLIGAAPGVVPRLPARPLYAARTGLPCSKCHVSPAGCWMRSPTGFAYALNGHTLEPAGEPEQTIDPKIADGLRAGADLRAMYVQDAKNPDLHRSTFFLMSAIVFVEGDISNRMTLYYSNDQGRTFETYGILRGLPLNGALRFGKFRPTYGVNEEDHTVFTEDSLGFGIFSEDTGVELSMARGIHKLTVGIVNGAPVSPLDNNTDKAFVGRAWSYGRVAGFGLSGYANTPQSRHRAYRFGALGNLHLGPVVFLGEYDRGENRNDSRGAPRRTVRLEAGFAELSYQIVSPGPTVKVKYDRFDHDLDVSGNARDRVGLWLESDLGPFTRVIGAARGTRIDAESRTVYDFLAQIYLFF